MRSCWLFLALLACAARAQEPDDWEAEHRKTAAELLEQWRNAATPEARQKLADPLLTAAVYSGQPEVVTEVVTGGKFAEREIAFPATTERVALQPLQTFPYDQRPYSNGPSWVVRRLTRNRFELWIPSHGWLFDRAGRLLNEARPPRRDGTGREWYGAFLPDGRWVTTDLWEMDKTLHFFSSAGKWVRDVKALDLVPLGHPDGMSTLSLIGWCRSDREGQGFVVSVGDNGGRGLAWVDGKGNHRLLAPNESPWALCYPRDLEPKGMYLHLTRPSDDGAAWATRDEPGHGMFVGYPRYEWGPPALTVPQGQTFGFWPGTHEVYVVTENYVEPRAARTWFFSAAGEFQGWVEARRLADDSATSGMLFAAADGPVVTLSNQRQVERVRTFTWENGEVAVPFSIFPDLHRGFFTRGKELVLARWK